MRDLSAHTSHASTPSPAASGTGRTRQHFIAADEVDWDYASWGLNQITGHPFDSVADTFVANGPDRIGHVYRKAHYRAYTEDTFSTLAPIDPR